MFNLENIWHKYETFIGNFGKLNIIKKFFDFMTKSSFKNLYIYKLS